MKALSFEKYNYLKVTISCSLKLFHNNFILCQQFGIGFVCVNCALEEEEQFHGVPATCAWWDQQFRDLKSKLCCCLSVFSVVSRL